MSKEGRDAILEEAAKELAWHLYAAAGYGRRRARISVKNFDREFRSAARKWSATHQNLTPGKEQ